MLKRICSITLLLTASSLLVQAQSKVGTGAVPFLGISVGSAATSMGGAVVAYADDASSLYWNPGILGSNPKFQVLFNHTNWLVNTKYQWIGVTIPVSDAAGMGISLGFLNYGETEVTTVTQQEGTGELWAASDMVLGVTYSQALTDKFSIGGTVKYVRQKIWNSEASSFALDLGILFVTDFNDMKLGMSVSNFGQDMTYDGKNIMKTFAQDPNQNGINNRVSVKYQMDSWSLPIFFRVGLAMDVYKDGYNKIALAVDAIRPSTNDESVNVGTEYSFNSIFKVRAGYRTLFRSSSEEGLTFGAGVNYAIIGSVIKFDYAYQSFGLFDAVHMYGVGIEF